MGCGSAARPSANDGGELAGIMGVQAVRDVHLIRHAYVLPQWQGRGVGGALLSYILSIVRGRVLVGTWADASWAIAFYERHGFHLTGADQKAQTLRAYWTIPDRQVETSVVLSYAAVTRAVPT